MEGIKKINTARSPRTPKGNNSPTFEQLLQGESSKWSSSSSPTAAKKHDHEDNFGHHNKKSVLTKVKERATKLKRSLSKKKHDQEDTGSPSSCIASEDAEDNDNAPEFLGAPMYESEQAPEVCKETIREQPRETVQTVSEKHILTSSIAPKSDNQKGNRFENNYNKENQRANESEIKYKNDNSALSHNCGTMTETNPCDVSSNFGMQNFEKGGEQTWDKGVSVKEYLMQKFEPGENEKALSQVITEAISPRKMPARREMGVIEMVREAVTSLLRGDETTTTQPISHIRIEENATQPILTSSTPPIPVSSHTQPVAEEENHGRILQAN